MKDDVKCNDPNCLRCHSSSHIQAFQSNAILLRRLVKLEPHLFDGMRDEIWSVIEDKLLNTSNNNAMHHRTTSWFFYGGNTNTNLMARLWTWWVMMVKRVASLSSHPPLQQQQPSSISAYSQAGQHPTVFFLPGLETTPLHDISRCPGGENCPCWMLWKAAEDRASDIIPSKKCRPLKSMTGDIAALINGYGSIRRELLDFISHHASTNGNENNRNHDQSSEEEHACFQPFDPNVYTHARRIYSSDSNGDGGRRASSDYDETRDQKQQPVWSSVYLYHRGVRQSNICDKYFPQTMHILETQCSHRMAGTCGLGSVYFSKLGRNTKVKEHCGPTNVRWRCHLPLIVPQAGSKANGSCTNASFLRVGLTEVNERRVGWEEGKPILFDDSFLHSAVHYGGDKNTTGGDVIHDNDSVNDVNRNDDTISLTNNLDGARIVLIVDFWHPSLSEMDRTALGVLYPPGS
jgi:hypothetical protein